MTQTEKLEIQQKLRVYISTFSSQKKACNSIDSVSEASIICMLNPTQECWSKISDQAWRNVAAQVGGVVDFNKLVQTRNFDVLTEYFECAKKEGATFAIVGNAGWGKSYTAQWYTATNRIKNVMYLECTEYMDRRTFLRMLLMQMGESYAGMGISEMMEALVRRMRKLEDPLVIMDEIDKLPDSVLKFFITFYNKLNRKCGFVWLSTNAIEKRITRGLDNNVVGYQELFSRIGGNFILLGEPRTDEVMEICRINGITDQEAIAKIVNEVRDLKGDLRRVDRNVLKSKIIANRKHKKAA